MVVHQIDIEYITVFEPEYDAPVTADADAPVPFPIVLQRMQAISGKVNVHRMDCRVEMGQCVGNALELIRPDLAGVSFVKQTLSGSMAERPYHKCTVPCIGTGVKAIPVDLCSGVVRYLCGTLCDLCDPSFADARTRL